MSSEFRKRQEERQRKEDERAQEERRRDLFKRRIEIARGGLRSFQQRKVTEAVRAFHSYLRVLEHSKKVPEGDLNPTLFDIKNDLPELLLISGVYWDLAKLYDRTKSQDKYGEFSHYLNKFVVFSKGMPYEGLSSETIRKYLVSERPMHKEAFRQAFRDLGGTQCFIATSLLDTLDEETFSRLRYFRDHRLVHSAFGRWFTRVYYRVSPRLVPWADRCPEGVRKTMGLLLDHFARKVTSGSYRSDSDGKSTDCSLGQTTTKAR